MRRPELTQQFFLRMPSVSKAGEFRGRAMTMRCKLVAEPQSTAPLGWPAASLQKPNRYRPAAKSDNPQPEIVMLYEMRTYELKVGATARYVRQFEEVGMPIVSRY